MKAGHSLGKRKMENPMAGLDAFVLIMEVFMKVCGKEKGLMDGVDIFIPMVHFGLVGGKTTGCKGTVENSQQMVR